MKHLNIHILQSYPVTCLNRDELGAPKSFVYGGRTRTRISSQCLKRATRLLAKEITPAFFQGERTRHAAARLKELAGKEWPQVEERVMRLLEQFCPFDTTNAQQSSALIFLSPSELALILDGIKEDKKDSEILKVLKKALPRDAGDIALFGRFAASNAGLSIEAASSFAHAFTTHETASDFDYYAAVEEYKQEDHAGTAMLGNLEFASGVFYRYACVDTEQLERSLPDLTKEEIGQLLRAFIQAVINAVPSARQHSMAGNTRPSYVLVTAHETGTPVQYAGAFETPVQADPAKGGYLVASIDALRKEKARIEHQFSYLPASQAELTEENDTTLDQLVDVALTLLGTPKAASPAA